MKAKKPKLKLKFPRENPGDPVYWEERRKRSLKRIKRKGSARHKTLGGIEGMVVRYEHAEPESLLAYLRSQSKIDGDALHAVTYLLHKYAPKNAPQARPLGSKNTTKKADPRRHAAAREVRDGLDKGGNEHDLMIAAMKKQGLPYEDEEDREDWDAVYRLVRNRTRIKSP